MKLVDDDPDKPKRKMVTPELKVQIRADMARGHKLHRLAVAYSLNAICKKYGLTRGQVQAACRRGL